MAQAVKQRHQRAIVLSGQIGMGIFLATLLGAGFALGVPGPREMWTGALTGLVYALCLMIPNACIAGRVNQFMLLGFVAGAQSINGLHLEPIWKYVLWASLLGVLERLVRRRTSSTASRDHLRTPADSAPAEITEIGHQ